MSYHNKIRARAIDIAEAKVGIDGSHERDKRQAKCKDCLKDKEQERHQFGLESEILNRITGKLGDMAGLNKGKVSGGQAGHTSSLTTSAWACADNSHLSCDPNKPFR